MEVMSGYKQTEVGVFPDDWDERKICDLRPFVTSGSRGWAAYYAENGSPFIRITNLSRQSIYLSLEDMRFVKVAAGDAEAARTQLKNGDVLISITADIGIIGFISDAIEKPAYINQHIALVRFNDDVCSKFVSYFLASGAQQKYFRGLTDAGAKLGMNLNTVQQVRLVLPPTTTEQASVAAAIGDADELIESLEQLLVKKRQMKQGAMQELLTGKKRLPGFACHWSTKRLGELGVWKGGMTPSMANPDFWAPGTLPWISSGDLKSSRLTSTAHSVSQNAVSKGATTSIPARSLVVVFRSGILRRYLPVSLTLVPMAINQDVKALVTADCVYPDYLLHLLIYRGGDILSQCLKSGTTVESLEFRWFKSFEVSLPSIPEQVAISELLNDLEGEISLMNERLAKARQLKQGIMQELLTGRIRLV